MLNTLITQIRTVPEYFIALQAAVSILIMGLPVYLGLRYFLHRRRLAISLWVTLQFVSAFILFAGLAFLLTSPLSSYMPDSAIRAYLFLTCIAAALGVVSLIDVFAVQYYAVQVRRLYVSPPLRAVIKLSVFVIAILPILRFVLRFDPLALVAIPTIATAGVALALQDTLKSFIAGIGLGRMIRIGEWIAFNAHEGRVIDMNWARTTIETLEGQRVFIPNSSLQSGIFLNYTAGDPANRQLFKVGVAYDIPPVKVKETLLNCIAGAPNIASHPPPQARLLEYADSAIVYGLFYWVGDYMMRAHVQDEVATRIWYAFQRERIVIPYPIRTVLLEKSKPTARTRKRGRDGKDL